MLLFAFLLGFISGLRTFTGPAVLWDIRHAGLWAYVLSAAALLEYFFDVHPKAPPRTSPPALVARFASGAFVGWWIAVAAGVSPPTGAAAGAIGALIGAYASLPVRLRAIRIMGNVASGLLEDSVAIVAAVAIVAHITSAAH